MLLTDSARDGRVASEARDDTGAVPDSDLASVIFSAATIDVAATGRDDVERAVSGGLELSATVSGEEGG